MTASTAPLVLVGPSGAGKTTLAHRLVDGPGDFVFSVSATTRPPRAGEEEGVDYHFVDEGEFRAMVERGELAEWAEVHGRLYGTPRAELDAAARRGERVVLDIDVQGARLIRDAVPEARSIFVLPPDVDIMLARLTRRGTEELDEIARRLRSARWELGAVSEFDHVVVNDDLERCAEEIRRIAAGKPTVSSGHLADIAAYEAAIDRVLEGAGSTEESNS